MIQGHFFKKFLLSLAMLVVTVFIVPSQVVWAQELPAPSLESADTERERVRARIVSLDEARLSAAVPAVIKQFHVREGERFNQGDVLVSLDCRVSEARLSEARVELEAAKQNRSARELLAETRSVGELELELARISVRQVQSSIETVQAELNQCRILAPFDGVVSKRHFNQAEFVRVGEPLLEVFDDSRLEAEFLVPSRWLPDLAIGDRIQIEIDELNRPIGGTIKRLAVSVNPVSQSLLVVGQLSDDLEGVRVGMSGSVRFLTE